MKLCAIWHLKFALFATVLSVFWPFAMMATKLSWLCGEWFLFGVPLQSRVLNALPSSFSVVLFGDKLQCQISMRTAGFGPFERRSWCNAKRVRMGNCVWMASVSQDEEKVAEVTESTAKCLSLDTR